MQMSELESSKCCGCIWVCKAADNTYSCPFAQCMKELEKKYEQKIGEEHNAKSKG